jgi:hypothetical protein
VAYDGFIDSLHDLAGLARSSEIALQAGPGQTDGDEAFVQTDLVQGSVITVSFTASTSAESEVVAAVGMMAHNRQILDSVTAIQRSRGICPGPLCDI